ncbi:cytochrome c oxidase assembly protein [Croceibacterium xixiisoli]
MTRWITYCGAAPLPADWLSRWNFDPVLLLAMAGAAIAWRLWPQRGDARAAGGLLASGLILYVSPLCALGAALFLVRILHDLALSALIAPLAVAAFGMRRMHLPGTLLQWTVVHILVFFAWHAPQLYAAAMQSDALFWAMQITIAGSAALWWAKLLDEKAAGAALSLLAMMVAMGMLGALLTFAEHAFYAPHWLTTGDWGFSPLEDQQLAGIVMWAPASAAYLLAAMVILYRGVLRGGAQEPAE